jgi:NAD(P)-dependent dehydrogenase (short-subunit alcohol dehydrogenase family)
MTRRIVITGASRGIGRGLVDAIADAGHTLIGCGTNTAIMGELVAAYPAPHRFDTVDVTDWDQVQDWAQEVLTGGDAPDLVINNAGVINRNAPLWEVPAEEFDHVLRVNLGGTANVIRAFLPSMIEAGTGIIVNMSSGWGRSTSPEVAPYCASKWGIEGLTQALSQELPPGLAVVAVSPGTVDTAMLRSCFGEAAGNSPTPDKWAGSAAKKLLALGARDNGGSISIG